MDYSPLPKMTVDDSSTRRQSKLYKLLIIAIVLGAFVFGYYLFSYSSENQALKIKQRKIAYQRSKYASAYATCEKTLKDNIKVAKMNTVTFQESNNKLQIMTKKQEESLDELEKANTQNSLKLKQAYQLFLDVKLLLKDDKTTSEDMDISPEASTALKTEIERLKAEHVELENLKLKHTETSKALDSLKTTHDQVSSQNQVLLSQVKAISYEHSIKDKKLDSKNMIIETLKQTIDKLQKEMVNMEKATVPPAQPVETAAPTALPVETAAPTAQNVETASPTARPVKTAAPTAQPVETAAPTAQPVETAAPTAQPVETAAPTAQPVEAAAKPSQVENISDNKNEETKVDAKKQENLSEIKDEVNKSLTEINESRPEISEANVPDAEKPRGNGEESQDPDSSLQN